MKSIHFLGGGAAVLIVGVVAFALNRGASRDADVSDAPEVPEPVVSQVEYDLADPGTVPEEPEAFVEAVETAEDDYDWGELSFDTPKIRNNGDGTVTMKKLVRIVEADGSIREVPITVTAAPETRRLPLKRKGELIKARGEITKREGLVQSRRKVQ